MSRVKALQWGGFMVILVSIAIATAMQVTVRPPTIAEATLVVGMLLMAFGIGAEAVIREEKKKGEE